MELTQEQLPEHLMRSQERVSRRLREEFTQEMISRLKIQRAKEAEEKMSVEKKNANDSTDS
jgi:hypothetical protein